MKAEEIRGMADEILSDGKKKPPKEQSEGDIDEVSVRQIGNGFMTKVRRKARSNEPYQESSLDEQHHSDVASVGTHLATIYGKKVE